MTFLSRLKRSLSGSPRCATCDRERTAGSRATWRATVDGGIACSDECERSADESISREAW